MKRILAVLFVVALYYVIQLLTLVLGAYSPLGVPDEPAEQTGWVWAFEHHFWQLVLALVAIWLLARRRWREWGLNLRNREESWRILLRFCYYYGAYFIGIGFFIQLIFLPPPALDHSLGAVPVVGRLAFGFLFVGVSEEILFRGLIHSYLARYWTGVWSWRGIEMPVAGVIAALIFVLAHVGFDLRSLAVTHLDPPQLPGPASACWTWHVAPVSSCETSLLS